MRKIRFNQIGSYSEDQLKKLLRVTVLETDRRLKDESPVKTGRFRVSWAIGENSAPFEGEPPGQYGDAPPRAVNYTLGNEQLGNVYSIHNNLPYAEPLARGHSQQAPKGWVQGIAKDMQNWVNQQANKIGQSS